MSEQLRAREKAAKFTITYQNRRPLQPRRPGWRGLTWLLFAVATTLVVAFTSTAPAHADDPGDTGGGSDCHWDGNGNYHTNCDYLYDDPGGGGGEDPCLVRDNFTGACKKFYVDRNWHLVSSPARGGALVTVVNNRTVRIIRQTSSGPTMTTVQSDRLRYVIQPAKDYFYIDARGRRVAGPVNGGVRIRIVTRNTVQATVYTPAGAKTMTLRSAGYATAAQARAATTRTSGKVKRNLATTRMAPQAAQNVADAMVAAGQAAFGGFAAGYATGNNQPSYGSAIAVGAQAGAVVGGAVASGKGTAGGQAAALAAGPIAGALGGAAAHLADTIAGGNNNSNSGNSSGSGNEGDAGDPGSSDFADGTPAGGGGGPIGEGGDSCCHE